MVLHVNTIRKTIETQQSGLKLAPTHTHTHTHSVALLHQLPVLSGEQAVTLEEGQEIVGTKRINTGSATS